MGDVTLEQTSMQKDVDMLSEVDENMDNDGRSSSLSEIDEASETLQSLQHHLIPADVPSAADGDSEAETERLENSPLKPVRAVGGVLTAKLWENSPSKLAQTANAEEQFSDSAISSPIGSDRESLSDDLVEASVPEYAAANKKRKLSIFAGDVENEPGRSPLKRVGSIRSGADEDLADEGEVDGQLPSNEEDSAGAEEMQQEDENVPDVEPFLDQDTPLHQSPRKNGTGKSNGSTTSTRRTLRNKGLDEDVQPTDRDAEPPVEEAAESEDEGAEDEGVDDLDAIAKSEEENARRLAAMDELSALEKHFATLRDRLYDEKISALNMEIAQLKGAKPTHPELLRQVKIVEKYRDNKFEYEQKLLVYKVGALKRKSIAERAQIHSAYYQTIRDLREKHLEKISEHFYRIQRDRFRTEEPAPNYIIPFPKQRQQQVAHQTAYNKEVSILSGVAKYVGFPAAPELSSLRQTDLEEDLEKMGISALKSKSSRALQRPSLQRAFSSTLSRPAAEEQFLEQTPWANPQHPVHQQLQRLTRPLSEQPRVPDSVHTPAQQQLVPGTTPVHGSASTLPENPSAPASSALNTPAGDQHHVPDNDAKAYTSIISSPAEVRRTPSSHYGMLGIADVQSRGAEPTAYSSPTLARHVPRTLSPRTDGGQHDNVARHNASAPLVFQQHPGFAASRLGVR